MRPSIGPIILMGIGAALIGIANILNSFAILDAKKQIEQLRQDMKQLQPVHVAKV